MCISNASKKRKPFDINKQRLSYLEGENLLPSKTKTASEIAVGKIHEIYIGHTVYVCSTYTDTHIGRQTQTHLDVASTECST